MEGERCFVDGESSKYPGESVEKHDSSDIDHETDGGLPLFSLGGLEACDFVPLLVADEYGDDDDKHRAVEENDDHYRCEKRCKESCRVANVTAVCVERED